MIILNAKAYEIVKAGREDLASALRQVKAGVLTNLKIEEIDLLRDKLRGLDALIRDYRRRRMH
jgi:hypothetical protein